MKRSILAGLLALSPTLALADGIIEPPLLPPPPLVAPVQYAPRHIYRDGQYFFCPHPDFDPYCRMPNDYSWALVGPPWRAQRNGIPPESRPGPPVLIPRLPPALAVEANRAIQNAMRPRYRKPPAMSMEEEREYIIRQGEEHCRKFPQDTSVCHPPKR